MFDKLKDKNNGNKIVKNITIPEAEQIIDELTEEEVNEVWDKDIKVTDKELKEIIKHDPRGK